MNLSAALYVTLLLACCAGHALAAPIGGVFIPRNGGYEAQIGDAHLFVDATAGGVLQVLDGDFLFALLSHDADFYMGAAQII